MKKVCLLDLNYTLVKNQKETRLLHPLEKRMAAEEYRTDLIDKIKKDFDLVLIITARPDCQREATMENLRKKTGWLPDGVYFNKLNLEPPACKERALYEYVFPMFEGEDVEYFGIESNPNTRAMYEQHKIASVPYNTYISAKQRGGSKMHEKNLRNYVYVCPYCFNKLEDCTCSRFPESLIQIDRNIWPIIKVLNNKWYFTEHCCEGHIGANESMFISFRKNYKTKLPLPKGFIGDGGYLKAVISGSSEQAKKRNKRKLLNALYAWANLLEDRKPDGFPGF